MCGIAGIIKFTPQPDKPQAHLPALLAMSAALAHRGPDGSGQFIDPRPNTFAALLHRRLAILDRAGGHQPMSNEDGTGGGAVHVIFNGEIYNHAELRRQLQQAGHRFASDHSDTEVLVHGWEEWGTDLPSRLRGMFAFAIWDTRPNPHTGQPNNTLFLARDRLGQKPLFYASLDDGIVFASTIPAILAWPQVPRRMPRELLALYLQLGYLPAPQTIWRDISQVMPAHWLRLRNDVLDGKRYWEPNTNKEDRQRPFRTEELRPLLAAAVESQLVADVPVACFLSGGIDSSIIAALMQQSATAAGRPPIHTVAVGFAESAFDETQYAAAVAGHIGSRHTRLEVDAGQGVIETLQMLMGRSLGQPFADSSILPTYHLSRAVRQIAPVALAGDGGDELFGGYDRYRAMQLLERWSGVARLMPRAAPLGSLVRRERYRRLAAAAREPRVADRYTRLVEITPPELLAGLLDVPPDFRPTAGIHNPHSALRHAMFRDQFEYLPGDLLYKVDSASMAEALEVRAPFLDHSLVKFANRLADDQLLSRGTSKAILRQTFAPDLPPAILQRPKKGFAVPIGTWFRTTLRQSLHDLVLSPTSFTRQNLHAPTIENLLAEHDAGARDHTHRLFALLMLELWAAEFHPTIE